jgi:phospholipid/cholesterol/gamma-HCH transport system substrate-binding protein
LKPSVNKALTVGALVAVTGITFLVAFTFFRKGGYSERDVYVSYAYFRDATGLTWKSRVQIAGIQVGEVSAIRLEGDRARLELRIKKEIQLHADACLTKSFPSALLPDALLEATSGSPGAPLLATIPEDQRELKCIREATSVQQLLDSLSPIAADVQVVTGDLAKTVGGSQGSLRTVIENVAGITRQLDSIVSENGRNLSDIISNARSFSADLKSMSTREKERVHEIAVNVEAITRQLREVLGSLKVILDGDAGGGRPLGAVPDLGVHAVPAVVRASADGVQVAALAPQQQPTPAEPGPVGGAPLAPGQPPGSAIESRGLRQSVDRLNNTLGRLDEIVGKVGEGKSAAGRLLTDERMGRQLGNAVEGISDYVDRLTKMQVEVQLRSEWLLNQSGAKAYFGGRIVPRPDKYYLFDIVSDPRGVDTVVTRTVYVRGQEPTAVTTTTHEERLTFSLQFAKRYGPLALRVGVIESSGGLGADVFMLRDRLLLSTSIYQFNRPRQTIEGATQSPPYPRAKVYLNYAFVQHLYLTVGVDDFLNKWSTGAYPGGPRFAVGTDVFFGAGLFFTDDDHKALIASGAGSAASALPK